MRRYETFIILDPELSEDQRSLVLDRVKEQIPQQGGLLAFIDEWGARRLAYEIKKREQGYYVRFDFCATGAVVDEMERFFRIDDRVLKYMTVLTDTNPDIDSIKEEIAKAKIEEAKTEESEETEASETHETDIVEDETPPIESEEEAK
jgi:small subunit ribosomal protein S6